MSEVSVTPEPRAEGPFDASWRRAGPLVLGVFTALMTGACAATPPPMVQSAAPDRGAPVIAADLARAVVAGRTGGLFELKQFRFHPNSADAIGSLCHWADAVKKLGLDPLTDVARVFVAATHALDATGIALIQLEVSDQIAARAITRAGGRAGAGVAFPRALVSLPGTEPHVIALIQPGLLVVVPQRFEDRLGALRTRAALPAPERHVAAQFFAFDPASSLGSTPRWPSTIVAAHADIAFTPQGGAVIRFFAESTSEQQARLDAKSLTEEAHRLLTVDLAIFELELLTPPKFQAAGRRVFMEQGLLPGDVDWVLRFKGGL